MALEKVDYVGGETVIEAENLNAIQDSVVALELASGAAQLAKVTYVGGETVISAENLNDIQDAIIALGQAANAGGVTLPALTNPGTAADLAEGMELIDGDGSVVAGTLPVVTDLTWASMKPEWDDENNRIFFRVKNSARRIWEVDGNLLIAFGSDYFGAAAPEDVVKGKTFTSATGLKMTGTHEEETIAEVEQATPEITISASGLITASATQGAGKVSAGTQSATKQLTTKAAQTITPGTTDQSIASGTYLTGAQTIKGDSNLVAGNIKSGVTIFGVAGTFESDSGGIDTSDATATAEDIISPATAYVGGEKITGSLVPAAIDTTVGAYYVGVDDDNNLYFTLANLSSAGGKRRVVNAGQSITLRYPAGNLGDATAADVAKGKTFTSSAGLLVEGTYEATSGGVETYHITSVDDVIATTKTGTVQVWGYGYYSASTYSKTTYSFVGDGYYSGSSYGTPSKTSATFGVGEDGKLSGLPSSLTVVDLLVTVSG